MTDEKKPDDTQSKAPEIDWEARRWTVYLGLVSHAAPGFVFVDDDKLRNSLAECQRIADAASAALK